MILSGVLRSRLRLARNRLWPRRGRGAPSRRWQGIVGLALFGWFFLLTFGAMAAVFSQLRGMGFGLDEAGVLLGLVLAGTLAGMLVFDVHYAVSSLLLDTDLELLRRAPLSAGALLGIKLVDSLPRTAALILAVGLPSCLAFGAVHGLPAVGWALVPVLLAGLWAVPLGIGLALALALVRVVPAPRAREALAIFSSLILVALWMLNSFVAPRVLEDDQAWMEALRQGAASRSSLTAASPPHWVARALVAARDGAAVEAVGWTALLVLAGAASLGVAALATRRSLEHALARLSAGEGKRRERRVRQRGSPAHGLPALLLKDARLFVRDWTVLGDVLMAAALWTLLPVVGGPLHQAEPAVLARFMLVALAVGLGYEVGARIVPYEGQGLAWSRLAPMSPWRWNGAKLLAGAMVSAPILAIAAVVIRVTTSIGTSEWLEAVATGIGALGLSLALGLWTGWEFGDPKWTNPRAMLTLSGRLVASGLLIVQAGLWLGLLAGIDVLRADLPHGIRYWGPLALATILGGPMLVLAVRASRRMEWSA